MTQKGFYNSMIAFIVLILIASTLMVQGTANKTKQAETDQRAIFELKLAMQNMQFLLDKATADAMADCYNTETCAVLEECKTNNALDFSSKINSYFASVKANAEATFGIKCNSITVQSPVVNNTEFSFSLSCYKVVGSDFKVQYAKTSRLEKSVHAAVAAVPPAPATCNITVQDVQSETCDIPESVNIADCPI